MRNQVVARFKDGRVLKGVSHSVDPSRPSFHVQPPGENPTEVRFGDLKALFFVRSLDGNPAHDENLEPDPSDPRGRGASVVRLEFEDGEIIVGLTIRYPPDRPYFYLVPVDPKSNNRRMLVNRDAVVLMEAISL
jgi:hypothetical protein